MTYDYYRTYPMLRRRLPAVLAFVAVALVLGLCATAYHVTTGEPAWPSPTTTATAPPPTGDAK